MTIQLGILLALLCALTTNLGFLLKHRGACAAPAVDFRRPVRSAAGLFRSRWFAIGMLVALGAWILHVGALALAPLSLVQAVISGGLVFLAVLADRYFGCEVGARQWIGVGLTAVGLSLLAMTLPHTGERPLGLLGGRDDRLRGGPAHGRLPARPVAAAGRLARAPRRADGGGRRDPVRRLRRRHQGADRQRGRRGLLGLVSPWLATCVLASVIAFYASARGLQQGEAVPVITVTSAAANVSAIAGGLVVFGDPMPGDALGIALQSLAFVMVIVAATLMPAPLRAAEAR